MLNLVQDYDKDPGFCGIVYDSRGDHLGYQSCDWDGRVAPDAFPESKVHCIWLPLHNDSETLDAFVGERKETEDGWLGKIWW